MRDVDTEPLEPFGLLVRARTSLHPSSIHPERLHRWLAVHRVVVMRGFTAMPTVDMARFCATLGEPMQWSFGLVNELHVEDDTENYLYTRAAVPLHWDGAFVGRIPHYIFFQCIEAPAPGAGGETLFCDTPLVLERAPAALRRRWSATELTYTTEKKVHYGGSFSSKMLARHPITDEETIRYAEPVEDLNPVSLSLPGDAGGELDALVADMRSRLYADDVCYAHAWRDGDLVIADNHALLHGRRAFNGSAARHLRRINIMRPPSRGPIVDFIVDNLLIRRVEYFVAEIPIVALPLLVSLEDTSFFGTTTFWEGVVVFFLLFNYGDMINAYADRELDKVYKPHLSRAVHRLGLGNVRWQIAVTAIAAVLVSAHLGVVLQNGWLPVLVLVGLGLGAAYSVEPLRLKGRGLLQLLCLWSIIFVGPMMFTSALVSGFPPPPTVLWLAAAYATIQMGVILFNTAEDYPEDREAGVKTSIVALGLRRGIQLGLALTVVGGAATAVLLGRLLYAADVPGPYAFPPVALAGCVYAGVALMMRSVIRATRDKSQRDAEVVVKAGARLVPIWVTAVAWSTFIAGLVLLLARRQ